MSLVKKVVSTLIGVSFLMGLVSPALAHTDVSATSPKDGSTIEAGSVVVSIAFNDKILDLADSSEIVVLDSENGSIKAECTKVVGKELQATVYFAKAGEYRVTWRTVAEDGHPLSGKFSFKVSGVPTTEYVRPPCAGPEPTEEPEVPAEPNGTQDDEQPDTTVFTLGALFLVVTVSIVFYELIRRRRARAKE
jgi:methionine-rich copper-binding protein CopC